MRTLKQIILIVGLAQLSPELEAQDGHVTSTIIVRTGYTTFDFAELRKLMRDGVALYRSYGIPLENQVMFPGNAFIGVECVISRGILRLGAGLYHTNTMAVAAYRDAGGSVRLKSETSGLFIEAVLGLNLAMWDEGVTYMAFKPGFLLGTWSFVEQVQFADYPNQNYLFTVDEAEAAGFFGDGVLGMQYRILPWLTGEMEAGYRFGSPLKLTIEGDEIGLGYDVKGFVGGIGLGVEF